MATEEKLRYTLRFHPIVILTLQTQKITDYDRNSNHSNNKTNFSNMDQTIKIISSSQTDKIFKYINHKMNLKMDFSKTNKSTLYSTKLPLFKSIIKRELEHIMKNT